MRRRPHARALSLLDQVRHVDAGVPSSLEHDDPNDIQLELPKPQHNVGPL